jgi:hypothetical protein
VRTARVGPDPFAIAGLRDRRPGVPVALGPMRERPAQRRRIAKEKPMPTAHHPIAIHEPTAAPSPALPSRRRHMLAGVAAASLLLGVASQARANPCPYAPRDFSFKSNAAFEEHVNLWPLRDRQITVDALAAAITAQNTAVYHNPQTVPEPAFLERFHDPNNEAYRNTYDFRLRSAYRQSTTLPAIQGNTNNGWSWGINPGHNVYDLVRFTDDRNRKGQKCRNEGLVLIGYFKWAGPLPGDGTRTKANLDEIRKDPRFLTTMVDLTPAHLPWLRALRSETHKYIEEVFDVKTGLPGDDHARMYFHWPTGFKTSTLHMHVRVNWQMGPLEHLRAYSIDEVISALESGTSTAQLIAGRYKRAGGLVMEREDGLDAFIQGVKQGPDSPVFGPKVALATSPFKAIKDIIKGVQVADTLYVVQRAAPDESTTNAIRYDSFLYNQTDWSDPKGASPLFTPDEVARLKLGGPTAGWPMLRLLACLLPYFDSSNSEQCVRINQDGTDIERVLP